MSMPISHRADLLDLVNNPCGKWHPFIGSVPPRMYEILINWGKNKSGSKRALEYELRIIETDFIDKCGISQWVHQMWQSNIDNLRLVKKAYALVTTEAIHFFASPEDREDAAGQIRADGVFAFDGRNEDERNDVRVYYGTSAGPIYEEDGGYTYYKVWEADFPPCVFVVDNETVNL